MRVKLGAAALACVLASGLALAAGTTASATPAQFPPATTAPPFPAPPTSILVPGATTTPPTTLGSAPTNARPQAQTPADAQDSDAGRTVWVAIAGLLVVAVLILALTVLYARHTRPARGERKVDLGPDEDRFTPTAARSVFGDGGQDEQTFWWAED